MSSILITGGSRGIGAATAIKLAEVGYKVGISYVQNTSAAEAVQKQITGAGGTAALYQADVSDEAQVIAMFDKVIEELGPLVGLVNNAGVITTFSRLEDISVERMRRIFDVNITGAFICAREAVKRMSTRNGNAGGVIVNTSSRAAEIGSPNEFIDYAASKGAIDSLTKGLSKEVAEEGIRVNAVRPGLIDTDIHADAGDPGRAERLSVGVPMKRVGAADEVADVICWLMSDASSYVTGTLIDVGGGR